MSNIQSFKIESCRFTGSCYVPTATHSKWNQHVKQMMMILHEKLISMKIIIQIIQTCIVTKANRNHNKNMKLKKAEKNDTM